MDQENEKAMYDIADKFINLANELSKSDPSGSVGAGLRFAAARYSAFEASTQTKALSEDKDKNLQLFTNDFNNMLQINLDDYIRLQSQN